jgi:hypothetical protein
MSSGSFALVIFLELLPLFADTDEGYQWEVRTDGGWTPY